MKEKKAIGRPPATDSYWKWKENDKELKRIRCPECDARHYWVRQDRITLQDKGELRVDCQCGMTYWIVQKESRAYIKTNRRGT